MNIPGKWEKVALKEVISLAIGGDWGKDLSYDAKDYVEVFCIRGSEFRNWHRDRGNTASRRKIKKSSLESRVLREGDILLEISGGGPEQPVGRTELIEKSVLAYQPDVPKICTNFLRLIRPTSQISAEFLNFFLKFFYSTGEIVNYQAGSNNLRNLKFDEYMTIKIPLAPLAEQRRIVSKIEELFSDLDAGEANLRAAQKLIARYRQSVLKAAVTGELTRDWRAANAHRLETGARLLGRILAARRAQWQGRGKYEEPQPPDTSDLPELPREWIWVRAEQVCDFITKGTTPAAEKLFDRIGEIPYIKVYNLTDNGRLDFTIKPTFINEQTHRRELARSRVFPKDVLMNIVGPPLGKVSVVPELYPEWNINQAIAIFRALQGYDYQFLQYCLLTKSILAWAVRRAKATAGQFNLTLEICRDLPLPLASLDEQQEIVGRLEELFSRIDALEAWCRTELARSATLRQSILKAAFSGQLVPQDPDDEPASALLERIRAERQAQPAKKNGRAPGAEKTPARRGRTPRAASQPDEEAEQLKLL